MDFHKKIHSDRHRPTPVFIIACFFSTVKLFCGISGKWGGVFGKKAKKNEPQATKKFFDPAIFQKCWRGSGRVALIAARRQRNPCAMLLAHGGGGEKSDRFSRRGEQDNVINLKRLLNGKQNVWKYQNGEEKSDSDGREKDV